jgi:hypothetical protein
MLLPKLNKFSILSLVELMVFLLSSNLIVPFLFISIEFVKEVVFCAITDPIKVVSPVTDNELVKRVGPSIVVEPANTEGPSAIN